MFTHLHVHSHYSLLEGLPSPTELAAAAAGYGMPALALTDHRYLTGAVEFSRACKTSGIRPIYGLELDLAGSTVPSPLVLLASNLTGWQNLCRLSSAMMIRPEAEPLITLDLLARHPEGLICLSGVLDDLSNARQLAGLFPGSFYFMLSTPTDSHTRDLAEMLRIPLVAAPPIYYLSPDQAPLQHTLAAIRLVTSIKKLPAEALAPPGSYFLSPIEVVNRFKNFPAALAATEEIAARCQFDLPLDQPHFPIVPVPAGLTAARFLRQKAEAGARQLYGRITPEIQQRLDHELEVIEQRGFETIFLIVEDIINFAHQTGVPTSSRGSAASSLVAHCIGITSPDPIRHDLYFERFLNPERSTPPDIDTDICSRRRDSVIQHVFDTYGAERVAMVGTINRFRPRSALGDVAKANGLPPERIHELTSTLPYGFFARMQAGDEDNEPIPPFAELKKANPSLKNIFEQAEALLKLPRHLSVHAGGLVVSPGPMTDLLPVMRSGSKGITITQMDLDAVEALGLVKIDLLGIRGLTVMGDVAETIHSWQRTEYRSPLDVLDTIPTDDVETSDRIENGQTIGCFQIESPGMRATLREINARSVDDVIAALALFRPGPISGGMKDAFVRRFKGLEPTSYLHPALEPLLKETHGVILYQEQVLRIAHELAGLSMADSDLLRRAMSHFDPGKQMQLLKEKFIASAQAKCNIPTETGEQVWELMAAFAGYGFPKAHAASYALLAWRSAWCKTHFPAEFMAAVLANWGGYYSQRVYLTEARRMGLTVKPPHVNHSKREFSVTYPNGEPVLYMGLDQVRDLTHHTIERICRLRPFHTLEDFLSRVDPRRGEAENLARCGAMEGFGPIPILLERIHGSAWQADQMPLFGWGNDDSQDFSLEQKMAAQIEILGTGLEAHPLELVAEQIAASGAISTLEAAEKTGERVTVAGMRQVSRHSRTAKGEMMMFLTLEDLEGTLDAVLYPQTYARFRNSFVGSFPLLVTGVMETDPTRGEPVMRVEKVSRLS
jgi:DNA-directed DNA polymerase III PolC